MHFFRYVSSFEKQSAISYLKMSHIHNFFVFGSKKHDLKFLRQKNLL